MPQKSRLSDYPGLPYKNLWEALHHYPDGVVEMLDYIVQDLGDGARSFQTGEAWFEASRDALRLRLISDISLPPHLSDTPELGISTYDAFIADIAEEGGYIARHYAAPRLVQESRIANVEAGTQAGASAYLTPFYALLRQTKSERLFRHRRDSNPLSKTLRWLKTQFSRPKPRDSGYYRRQFPKAEILIRNDSIYIVAVSGHWINGPDFAAFVETTRLTARPEELGQLVRQALKASRFIDYETEKREATLLFNVTGPKARQAWERRQMRKLEISSKMTFWAPIRFVGIAPDSDGFKAALMKSEADRLHGIGEQILAEARIPASAGDKEMGEMLFRLINGQGADAERQAAQAR